MREHKRLFIPVLLLLVLLFGCSDEHIPSRDLSPAPPPEPAIEMDSPTPAPPAEIQEQPEEVPPEEPQELPEEDSEEITYVLNTNTRKFHKPTCRSVQDISPKNYLETSKPREQVISDGYKPCKNCEP